MTFFWSWIVSCQDVAVSFFQVSVAITHKSGKPSCQTLLANLLPAKQCSWLHSNRYPGPGLLTHPDSLQVLERLDFNDSTVQNVLMAAIPQKPLAEGERPSSANGTPPFPSSPLV